MTRVVRVMWMDPGGAAMLSPAAAAVMAVPLVACGTFDTGDLQVRGRPSAAPLREPAEGPPAGSRS